MAILGNYENNYDTETTTANNSMGFDPSAIQSCCEQVVNESRTSGVQTLK